MKKALIFLLAAALACLMLVGCAAETPPAADGDMPFAGGEPGSPGGGEGAPAGGGEPQPLCADRIRDGTYAIEVSSSSSMFRIIDAQLTVAGGEMSAVLTLSGDGYEKLYMGTGEQALADTDDKCVYFVENAEGKYTYEVPVAALDQDIDCAAWSIRKQMWYDRVLVFQSSLIPGDAIELAMALPARAAAQPPADGRYTVGVALSGGSGRAEVQSPAVLTVEDGAATAVVIWSSPYYEYMLVGGVTYYPVNTGGNSAFEIPAALDEDLAVSALTVAMSRPHEIDYTLRFDSATLKPLSGAAAPAPLAAAAAAAALVALSAAGGRAALKRRAKGRQAPEGKQSLER